MCGGGSDVWRFVFWVDAHSKPGREACGKPHISTGAGGSERKEGKLHNGHLKPRVTSAAVMSARRKKEKLCFPSLFPLPPKSFQRLAATTRSTGQKNNSTRRRTQLHRSLSQSAQFRTALPSREGSCERKVNRSSRALCFRVRLIPHPLRDWLPPSASGRQVGMAGQGGGRGGGVHSAGRRRRQRLLGKLLQSRTKSVPPRPPFPLPELDKWRVGASGISGHNRAR